MEPNFQSSTFYQNKTNLNPSEQPITNYSNRTDYCLYNPKISNDELINNFSYSQNNNKNFSSYTNLNMSSNVNNPIMNNINTYEETKEIQEPQNIPDKKTQSQNLVDELENIYEDEKDVLQSRINTLVNELNITKKSLGDRIGFLNQHLEKTKIEHERKKENINKTHLNDLSNIVLEKDEQINKLIQEIKIKNNRILEERNFNINLVNQLKDYEELIKNNKELFDKDVLQLDEKYKDMQVEFKTQEFFYKSKINEIRELHTQEKNKIINSYEEFIENMKKGYFETEKKYKENLLKIEENIKETKDKNQNERTMLENEIRKLQEDNEKDVRQQFDLELQNKKLKKDLKQIQFDCNDKKQEIEKTEKKANELNSKINKVSQENKVLEAQNSDIDFKLNKGRSTMINFKK